MSKLMMPDPHARNARRLNRSTTASVAPGLQGSATASTTGGTVTNGNTYSEVVAVAQSARVRVRILTVGATGTLNVKPIAPVGASAIDESVQLADGTIDPSKVTAYSTGNGTAAVSAATEAKVDVDLYGENYVLVQFVCTGSGTITWVDISQV